GPLGPAPVARVVDGDGEPVRGQPLDDGPADAAGPARHEGDAGGVCPGAHDVLLTMKWTVRPYKHTCARRVHMIGGISPRAPRAPRPSPRRAARRRVSWPRPLPARAPRARPDRPRRV